MDVFSLGSLYMTIYPSMIGGSYSPNELHGLDGAEGRVAVEHDEHKARRRIGVRMRALA